MTMPMAMTVHIPLFCRCAHIQIMIESHLICMAPMDSIVAAVAVWSHRISQGIPDGIPQGIAVGARPRQIGVDVIAHIAAERGDIEGDVEVHVAGHARVHHGEIGRRARD